MLEKGAGLEIGVRASLERLLCMLTTTVPPAPPGPSSPRAAPRVDQVVPEKAGKAPQGAGEPGRRGTGREREGEEREMQKNQGGR